MKYRIKLHLEDRDGGSWDERDEFSAEHDEAAEQRAIEEAASWFHGIPHRQAAITASIELTDISDSPEQAVSTLLCRADDEACPTIHQHRSFKVSRS